MTTAAPLAEVTRRDVAGDREFVEAIHLGHLVVTGPDGTVLAAVGDPENVNYVRSTAKPFQATACLELLEMSGTVPSPAEIAVAWSSHRGEPTHVDTVRRLLARSGTSPSQLTCPPATGEADPAATPVPVLHGCSGKHALFALAAMEQATGRDRMLDHDGPLQRVVLDVVAEVLGPPRAIGVDGCGAPAVAVPLAAVARAYAAVTGEARWQRVRDAGLAHPGLVGGEGRLETALLGAGVVAKPGAEGVFGAGWVGRDGQPRGLAVKGADGAARGVAAAVVTLLTDLEVVASATWMPPPPLGGGRPAGTIRAADGVRTLATSTPEAR